MDLCDHGIKAVRQLAELIPAAYLHARCQVALAGSQLADTVAKYLRGVHHVARQHQAGPNDEGHRQEADEQHDASPVVPSTQPLLHRRSLFRQLDDAQNGLRCSSNCERSTSNTFLAAGWSSGLAGRNRSGTRKNHGRAHALDKLAHCRRAAPPRAPLVCILPPCRIAPQLRILPHLASSS